MEGETYNHDDHDIRTKNDDHEIVELQPEVYNKSEAAPEIVEIIEEENDGHGSCAVSGSKYEGGSNNNVDVYVAVGKDDLEVLKWALGHAVSPGARVNLIHVFPPLSYISTPVGKLRVSQLSPDQAKVYAKEEENKRRHLLQKYIRLCIENKVNVDTMLLESTEITKAILHLIPVLNITSLIMGTKHPHSSRRLIKGLGKGMLVQRSAPDFCTVVLVYIGKKHMDNQVIVPPVSSSILASNENKSKTTRQPYETPNFTECRCFPVKFY